MLIILNYQHKFVLYILCKEVVNYTTKVQFQVIYDFYYVLVQNVYEIVPVFFQKKKGYSFMFCTITLMLSVLKTSIVCYRNL